MNENFIEMLSKQKILPIIRENDPDKVINIASALHKGGFNIMEVNVQNIKIYDAIKEISSFATVCGGGIITSLQAQAVLEAGAKFISSPIYHMNLVKYAKGKRILYIAGASTANEAYEAWKSRVLVTKIYPVNALGGTSYIKNLLRPMPFIKVIPQGDVKLNEVKSYIDAGAIAVGVGRDLLEGYSYSDITARTQEAIKSL